MFQGFESFIHPVQEHGTALSMSGISSHQDRLSRKLIGMRNERLTVSKTHTLARRSSSETFRFRSFRDR